MGFFSGLSMGLHLTYHEAGFVQMLLVDSNSFNRSTYQFQFVRNDFLGTIPTVVFDVSPIKRGATGRFAGRVWIERNSGNIVRFKRRLRRIRGRISRSSTTLTRGGPTSRKACGCLPRYISRKRTPRAPATR